MAEEETKKLQVIEFQSRRSEPNSDLVELLENQLAAARSGELQSLVLVGISPDGLPYYTGGSCDDHDHLQLIAGLDVAKFNLLMSTVYESESIDG